MNLSYQIPLKNYQAEVAKSMDSAIDNWAVDNLDVPDALREAMVYSFKGGKYLRPLLIFTFCDFFKVNKKEATTLALAAEMIQAYSLIHDDLPSMDNSRLRRGRESCWVKFGESTAILAGDAFLTEAFLQLAKVPNTAKVVAELASQIGGSGMIAGQIYDLAQNHKNIEDVSQCQELKTSCLFRFCCTCAALVSSQNKDIIGTLIHFSMLLGLNFQMTDDLLDIQGDASQIGKETGQDKDKMTFVSHYGISKVQEFVKENTLSLKGDLKTLGTPLSNHLWQLLDWLVLRKK